MVAIAMLICWQNMEAVCSKEEGRQRELRIRSDILFTENMLADVRKGGVRD